MVLADTVDAIILAAKPARALLFSASRAHRLDNRREHSRSGAAGARLGANSAVGRAVGAAVRIRKK